MMIRSMRHVLVFPVLVIYRRVRVAAAGGGGDVALVGTIAEEWLLAGKHHPFLVVILAENLVVEKIISVADAEPVIQIQLVHRSFASFCSSFIRYSIGSCFFASVVHGSSLAWFMVLR